MTNMNFAKTYLVEEVSYGNSEISLSGTLTLPMTTGPFPAVILIHGSSPLDRDEAMLGHKPFLVLSDHFTRNGIAVLRFDKRGVGKSTGIYETATIEDFCDDVAKGVEFYTIIELPNLNHGFQTCVIGSWDEYEKTEETIAPSALNIMTDWILERAKK